MCALATTLAIVLGVGLVLGLGCDDPPPPPQPMRIDQAVPTYAPLRGGTRVQLIGSGFAPANGNVAIAPRVLIGGREAPFADRLDDSTLVVVVPPGDRPGDAEVVVFDSEGSANAFGIFHYSSPPVIDSVTPAKVLVTEFATLVTISGSGFRDEGAGILKLLVDGQLVVDAVAASDTTLAFSVPTGPVLSRPTIELVNERGTATRANAFRYVPSERDGLLLFPTFGQAFAIFFDPVDNSTIQIPWSVSATTRFTTVFRDELGEYWAIDRAGRFGVLDMRTQRIVAPIQAQGLFPTITRVGSDYLTLERTTLGFGRFDLATSAFTRIGDVPLACCGSFGLAYDGETLYYTSRGSPDPFINTIDPATGTIGTPVPLVAGDWFHIEELRFFAGKLYASSRDNTLVTIDPATGMVTTLPVSLGRFNAIEVLD